MLLLVGPHFVRNSCDHPAKACSFQLALLLACLSTCHHISKHIPLALCQPLKVTCTCPPPVPTACEQANFDDVLQVATQFLQENPSEFLLMHVKDEVGGLGQQACFLAMALSWLLGKGGVHPSAPLVASAAPAPGAQHLQMCFAMPCEQNQWPRLLHSHKRPTRTMHAALCSTKKRGTHGKQRTAPAAPVGCCRCSSVQPTPARLQTPGFSGVGWFRVFPCLACPPEAPVFILESCLRTATVESS